ncbi:MAG: hypothetical protein KatS3mg110_2722 [Pirellulaceae bacterium]|nr:MAG: hypothetical protein KatS3mg110_2722 [Pirellulaceae bacterium]
MDDGAELRIAPATRAIHQAAGWLLGARGSAGAWDIFHSVTEVPDYAPEQRLLVYAGREIVGHVRLVPCRIFLGHVSVACCQLTELVVRSEWHGQGIAEQLVERAFSEAVAGGACLVLFNTEEWRPYLKRGWLPGPRHCYSTIQPRRLLAHLRRFPKPLPDWWDGPRPDQWTVRQLRRSDLPAIELLYRSAMQRHFGPVDRTDSQWQWLVEHGGDERLYVVECRRWLPDVEEPQTEVHGYMALRQGQVLELVASANNRAREALLIRAADEAIESDWHLLRFDAPWDSCLHGELRRLGAETYQHDIDAGWACLMKPASPASWIAATAPLWTARAKKTGLPASVTLSFLVNQQPFTLSVSGDSVHWQYGLAGSDVLYASLPVTQALLLGRYSAAELLAEGKLRAKTKKAAKWAEKLFVELPWWRQVWQTPVPSA